ncbi:MAG: long-chain fatty acid--CoA ligase [Clostridiales bacterium]|nr:long-chain fatty acid--CoA ligase [Clostridiales bacterium]
MEGDRPWYRHYPPEVPRSLEYPDEPICQLLTDAVRDFPDQVATIFYNKKMTFREIHREARRLAHGLLRLGVKPGDRVALMLPNIPQAVAAYYGLHYLGAVVVWVNPLYMPHELIHQLSDSGAETIIALDLLYPRIMQAWEKTPLKRALFTSVKDRLPFPLSVLYPLRQKLPKIQYNDRVLRYDAVIQGVTPEEAMARLPGEEKGAKDLALLQYTGGTTGVAKGAMLTHGNLMANVVQARAWLYKIPRGQGVVLAALPFFHVYGLTTVLHFAVAHGHTMVLLPRPDGKSMLEAIVRYKVRLFPGTPTMYVAVLQMKDLEKYDLSSVEACISGSAPLPLEVQQQFEKITGGRLVEGYGLTEASPVTHSNPIWGERRNGTIGLPWPDTDAKIVDPDGDEELPVGEVGELLVKGPQVMQGYWNRPDETEQVLKDGWLRTGDLGRMDEDGYFQIVDRKKDVIIASGYNIYPREVEEVLYAMPEVAEAAVVGAPDPYRGETVRAYIVLKEGATLTAEEVERRCREQLAAYKVPRQIIFRKELPKSAVGKILRRVLAEEAKQEAAQAKTQ